MAPRYPSVFPAGRVLAGRYEIERQLGSGTSGVVYLAHDRERAGDDRVALKVIHEHLYGDRQIFGRFRREAQILTRLNGPHVTSLLELIEDEGRLILAIEYFDGVSLEQYLEARRPLGVAEALAITAQICSALEVAHAAGVIHRDLKPANVLIEGPGPLEDREPPASLLAGLSVRVVDFGLAKLVHGDTTGTALTEHDMIFGTPDYMSPEQVRGDELDARCDVYSAGVMLFEMLVGHVPFDAPTPLAMMTAHLDTPPPIPSAEAMSVRITPAIDRCVLKALAKNVDARHASAAEFRRAIEELGQGADALDPLADEDTVNEEEQRPSLLGVQDTHHAAPTPSTTMSSRIDQEAAAAVRSNPVKIVVRDAAPASNGRPRRLEERAAEQRLWTVLALVAALLAVAAGVFFGVR